MLANLDVCMWTFALRCPTVSDFSCHFENVDLNDREARIPTPEVDLAYLGSYPDRSNCLDLGTNSYTGILGSKASMVAFSHVFADVMGRTAFARTAKYCIVSRTICLYQTAENHTMKK